METPGIKVARPLAVYLEMLDSHAAYDVANGNGPAPPVGHVFLLAPVALTALAFARSTFVAPAIVVVMLLWILGASVYYGRAYRRYRIAMGVPAGRPGRYLFRQLPRIIGYTALWLAIQVLVRRIF